MTLGKTGNRQVALSSLWIEKDLVWDHFEGRTYRGWNHHTVLTTIAFVFWRCSQSPATAA